MNFRNAIVLCWLGCLPIRFVRNIQLCLVRSSFSALCMAGLVFLISTSGCVARRDSGLFQKSLPSQLDPAGSERKSVAPAPLEKN